MCHEEYQGQILINSHIVHHPMDCEAPRFVFHILCDDQQRPLGFGCMLQDRQDALNLLVKQSSYLTYINACINKSNTVRFCGDENPCKKWKLLS